MTMQWIASQTITTTGITNINFTSIPQTFTHLQLRVFAQDAGGTTTTNQRTIFAKFNNDSGTNYSEHRLLGDGSSVSSTAVASQSYTNFGFYPESGFTNVFGVSVVDILDYTNVNKNKVLRLITGNDTNSVGVVAMMSGAWYSTSAITSINLYFRTSLAGVFSVGTRIDLYGITTSDVTGA